MATVVFLWHMHQPYYVNPVTNVAMMPWVRLHSVKGYLDMVSVLEEFPEVKVNFNLTPVLLLQIEQLVRGEIRELWLEWSRKPAADLDENEKLGILENFFKIHWDNMLKPHARYWELLNKRGQVFHREEMRKELWSFQAQEFLDLQVWYNLAWCGYTACRLYPELEELKKKGRNFTEQEKGRVLEIHLEIMGSIIPKYRAAEERGQVEITTTPFFHPILPLVYDTVFAERAMQGRPFPKRFHWPQDAAAHLKMAVEYHEHRFGRKPRGLWPSEGSIAPELIPLMKEAGIRYFCSDEENLFNTLKMDPAFQGRTVDHLELFQGWTVANDGSAVNALFREKPLSDFIGFMAAKNSPEEAAQHLLHHLSHITGMLPDDGVIPLILDGENAWETFADGGESFLKHLYRGISGDEKLQSLTMERYLEQHPPKHRLTTLHTGSWISGNFDIWIGEEEENRAWDLLGEARSFLENEIRAGNLDSDRETKAMLEIYAAEGSDWFWWYGPDFNTENDALFDGLFRLHLKNVYSICGRTPPAILDVPIATGQTKPVYQPPQRLIRPEITGRQESYFEWLGAGCYRAGSEQGAMYHGDRALRAFYFGFDPEAFYMRVDLVRHEKISLRLLFNAPREVTFQTDGLVPGKKEMPFTVIVDGETKIRHGLVMDEIVEWKLDRNDIGFGGGEVIAFKLQILEDGLERESYPENGWIEIISPSPVYALQNWGL